MIRRVPLIAALAAALAVAVAACRASTDSDPSEPRAEPSGERVASVAPAADGGGATTAAVPGPASVAYDDHGSPVGLHNYHPFTDRIVSGAQPEGEVAFRHLAALGIRTVVSVDGAMPDVALAKKHGLRYVHIPLQYSAVTRDEQKQLAKAIETTDGPVYIHCHHGKHRSPAATGAVCVALGLMTPDKAVAKMKECGTDPKYQGLYRDVAAATPLTPEQLAAVSADLPECVKPGDLAGAMVDVDLRWDHLKASKEAKWAPPPKNPDIDPPHEARMLWEAYREISRLEDAKSHGEKFIAGLAEGEAAAKALEDALRAKNAEQAGAAFDRIGKACSSCHKQFRDN